MGQCLATLLSEHCDLMICSRVLDRAKAVSCKVSAKAAEIEGCSDRDIVFLAVPTKTLSSTAAMVSGIMPVRSLIVDISSVKCGVVEVIDKSLPQHICYVSIHPLFSSPGARIKNTIVVPIRPGPWMQAFTNLLLSSGIRVYKASMEEHDKAMAATQVIHHFALLSMKRTLAEMGYANLKSLEPYVTNSLRKTMSIVRLLEKNLETIEMIQRTNKFSSSSRKNFIETANRLDEKYAC